METDNTPANQTPAIPQLEEKKDTKLSEGIMLALASASAYLLSFTYEAGFASIFKIPPSLISINLTSVLIFGAGVLGVLFLSIPIVNMAVIVTLSIPNPVLRRTVGVSVFVIILTLIQIYPLGVQFRQHWTPYIIVLLVFLFLQFIFPLITQREKGYINKLAAQEETERQIEDVGTLVRRRFGREVLLIVSVLLLCFALSNSIGKATAMNQSEFLVTNTSPEMVVLRIYGENLICVPFNRNTREIENRFVILKTAESPDLILTIEKLGPLHTLPLATTLPITQATNVSSPLATPPPPPTNVITP